VEGDRRTDAPLSVVSEDCIRLAEREKLFPGLRLFVHIRVKLLAQLQKAEQKIQEGEGGFRMIKLICCCFFLENRECMDARNLPCNRWTRRRMRHRKRVRLSADLDLTLACVHWDGQRVIMNRVMRPSRGECPPRTKNW